MSDLTLWDDKPAPAAPTEPLRRNQWDRELPCHICGQHLVRWMRTGSPTKPDWYSWELMEPTWTHLRAHWAALPIIAVIHGPIRNGQAA
jgi:hypothetical protein